MGPLRYRGGVPGRRATEHQEAGLLEPRDLSVWMIEALTHMSSVETVALSAIIATALALLWRGRFSPAGRFIPEGGAASKRNC